MSAAAPHLEFNEPRHAARFIELNEQWISQHFALEDADRKLAADPMQIVARGGHILCLVDVDRVVGVCALFNEGDDVYQLARMAVDPQSRGLGYGDVLIEAALERAAAIGAKTVYLVSNTVLAPAIALYRKHGFSTRTLGQHPTYARANIVMERHIEPPAL